MYVYKIHDILYWVVSMKLLFSILLVFLITGCQSIENKTDEIGKREIQELSKFLQQPETELKIEMGQPNEIIHNEKGSKFYIYKKKKYGITCEKKFEIDENNMIAGVSSRGCF
jgi:hypothetical protein